MRFKRGDKVKAILRHDNNTHIVGKIGKIIEAGDTGCKVRFDVCIDGHGEGKREWNIPYSKLKLVGPRTWDMSHVKKFGIAVFIDALNAKQKSKTTRRKK